MLLPIFSSTYRSLLHRLLFLKDEDGETLWRFFPGTLIGAINALSRGKYPVNRWQNVR